MDNIDKVINYKKENPLELYRQKYQFSYAQLQQQIGIARNHLSNYVLGKSYPSHKTKKHIETATNGEVSSDSWPPSLNRKAGRPRGIGKSLKYG